MRRLFLIFLTLLCLEGFPQSGWVYVAGDDVTPLSTRINWRVRSISFNRGSAGVYAGGSFTDPSGNYYVGLWDSNNSLWTNAENFMGNGEIFHVGTGDPLLTDAWASGQFTNDAGQYYIAAKGFNNWTDLTTSNVWGNGVEDFATNGTNFYGVGSFSKTNQNGSTSYFFLAKYDGDWQDIGDSMISKIIYDKLGYGYQINLLSVKMHVDEKTGELYVACKVQDYSDPVYYSEAKMMIFKYDGSWSQLGDAFDIYHYEFGIPGSVRAIATFQGSVYIAGDFLNSTGNYYVATLGNGGWEEYGYKLNGVGERFNPDGPINSLALSTFGFELYAAGEFTDMNGNAYVAKADALGNWSPLGDTALSPLRAPIIFSICYGGRYVDDIYASGSFFDSTLKSYFLAHFSLVNCTSMDLVATDTNIVAGAVVTFNAYTHDAGSLPTYKWQKNHTTIPNQITSVYKDSTLQNNDIITCTVIGNKDCSTAPVSDSVTIHSNSNIVTYSFTGNGNWNNSANWQNGMIPPAVLTTPGAEIIISPSAGNECILNINQTISAGTKLTVAPNAKFRVLGDLKIQN